MGQAAKILEAHGYDEVNINCGCPSQKTKDGCFGAILMFEPKLVAQICAEMRKQVSIPVTVKCRLGVDDHDSYPEMVEFIRTVSEEGGITKFIIHARKAYLSGLNPKQNRTVPPLKYSWVFELKKEFPHLNFVINGGFNTIDKVQDILSETQALKDICNGLDLEGCMSGRMAMNTPWEIARIDSEIFGDTTSISLTREEILRDYADFVQKEQDAAQKIGWNLTNNILIRPLIHLFTGEFEGAKFRGQLTSTAADKSNVNQVKKVILQTLEAFKSINPEAMMSRNGVKVIKPAWKIE